MNVVVQRLSFRLSNGRTIDLTMDEVEALRSELNRIAPAKKSDLVSKSDLAPLEFDIVCKPASAKRK